MRASPFLKTVVRWSADRRGVSAVEFALVLPILLTLFFGGYQINEALAISRKVSVTTETLANLTTQYNTCIPTANLNNIMAAASQIVAPFSGAPLQTTVSEINTDALGLFAYVTWSTNTTNHPIGSIFTGLPTGLKLPNSYYIYVEVKYNFTPALGYGLIKSIPIADQIYMVPRKSTSLQKQTSC